MSRAEVLKQIETIFQDLLDDEDAKITEETSRDNLEDWDSLFHMTLMASLTDEFGVSFTTEQIVESKDVRTLADIIEAAL